jgi:hypothetical protein
MHGGTWRRRWWLSGHEVTGNSERTERTGGLRKTLERQQQQQQRQKCTTTGTNQQ